MGASTSAPAPPVSTTATSQRHHQTQLLFSPAKAGRQQQLPPMVHQRIPSAPTPPRAECGTCPSSRSASPRRLVPLSSRPEQQSFHRPNNDGHHQVLLPLSPHNNKTSPSSTGSETPVHELVGILPPPSPANGPTSVTNDVSSQQHALQQTTTVLQGESALSPTFSLSQQATPTTTCSGAAHHNHDGHAKSAMESFSPSSPLQQEEQQQVVDQRSFQHRHKKGHMVKNFSSEELVLLTPCSFLVEEDDREGEDAVMFYCNGKEKIEDDNREVWICRDAVEGDDGSHSSQHTGGARRHCVKDAQDTDEDHHSCSLHTDSQGGLSYSHSHSRSIHTTGMVPTKFLLKPLAPAAIAEAKNNLRTTTCTPDRDPATHPKPFAFDRHLADDRCRSHCTPTLDQDDDNLDTSSVAPLVTLLPQPPSTTSLCDGAESSSGHEAPQQQPQRASSPPLPTTSSRATRGRRQRNIRFGGITSEVHLSGHGEDLPDNIILTMDMFKTSPQHPQRKGHYHHRHRGGYTTSLGDTVSGGPDGHNSVVGVPSLGPLIDDDDISDRWNNNNDDGCGGNPLEGADEEEQVALMALPRQVRQRVGGAGAGGHHHHTHHPALPASAHQPAIKSKYKMDFDVPSSSCSTSFDVEEEEEEEEDNNEGGHHGGNGCSGGPVLSVLGVDAPRPKDPQTGDISNPTTTAQEQNVIASTQPRSKTRTTLLMTTPSRHQSFTMNCLAPPPTPVSQTQGASPSRNTNDNGENQSSTNEKQLRFIREYHRTVSDVKNHAPVALRRR